MSEMEKFWINVIGVNAPLDQNVGGAVPMRAQNQAVVADDVGGGVAVAEAPPVAEERETPDVLGDLPNYQTGPVSADVHAPTLVSLRIEPADGTIEAGKTLPLRAEGIDSIGDPIDLTYDVIWTSDSSGISIDDTGVAKAILGSATANITATHRDSGKIAHTTLTIKTTEMQSPPAPPQPPPPPAAKVLKSIKIKPDTVSVFLQDSFSLYVTGEYMDGSKVDLTADVEWDIALLIPDVVEGPYGPFSQGDSANFRTGNVGDATITASAKIGNVPPATATVTVSARPVPPAPPPPPKPKPVQSIDITPAEVEALPGEDWTFHFKASLPLAKGIVWSCTPEKLASVNQKSGVAHMKAVGEVTIIAKDPATGAEGKALVHVVDPKTVFDVSPIPKAGTVTKDDYAALIDGIVAVGQAKYMHWEMPPMPVDLPKRWPKDPALHNYLQLAMQMVAFWNDAQALIKARGIWKRIQPHLDTLLTEAISPKVGIKPRDVQLARESMDRLDKYVNSPRDSGERLDIREIRTKDTPFGKLVLWQFEESEVMPILDAYDDLKSLFPSMQAKARQLDDKNKIVEKATKPPADYLKDIKDHATKNAEMEAKAFRLASNEIKTVQLLLGNIKDTLQSAKTQVDNYIAAVSTAETIKRAAEARREAEEQALAIDACLGVLKGVGVGIIEGPVGAMEAIDVAKDLRRLFKKTPLEERAEKLENMSRDMQIKDAENNLALARTNVANAEKFLKQAEEHIGALGEDADLMRAEAEQAFDKNAGKFQFKPVSEGIDLTVEVRELGGQISMLVKRSAMTEKELARADQKPLPMPGPHQNRPDLGADNGKVISAFMTEINKMGTQAGTMQKRAEDLNQSLREIRVAAHNALFTSKDPRPKK